MAPAQYLLLNTGRRIPTVGLGVYKTPAEQCVSLVHEALNVGYRHIDSAALYYNEEEVCEGISNWLAEDPSRKREDVFYTTKIGDAFHGYEKTKNAIKVSLEKAKKIQYIDLILIHSPQSDGERRHGSWKALEEAYEAGTVKNIGVSNYGIKHLKELLAYPDLKVKPAINQFELHPWLQRPELVGFCRQHDIAVEAYSPLARGQKVADPVVVKIGEKYKKTAAQILIRWSLEQGFITLPKTATKARLAPNLDRLGPNNVSIGL
ncbi:hypothetical protein KL918_004119 [Ogataea parapolymorpha]|nr:hypothetical protein KL918_004119 [Ogataea parapolymorpha]KAG7874715.1 hypothetical protein KL916_000959 [Ogataea parapolymorpha]